MFLTQHIKCLVEPFDTLHHSKVNFIITVVNDNFGHQKHRLIHESSVTIYLRNFFPL